MNYESPHEIKAVLEKCGITLKKRWGQNFLINRGAREKIVRILAPQPTDTIWEIGPGLGALTVLLLDHIQILIAFEIDRGLVRWLEAEFAGASGLMVCQGDVLKNWMSMYQKQGMPDKICGNLPYNSASAIILSFIRNDFSAQRMVFTVQRELANRITAQPGSKNYSGFSVLCQSMFKIETAGELKPGSFFPQPDVLSTIIMLAPEKRINSQEEKDLFFKLVRAGFSSRRKILKNNIKHSPDFSATQRQQILDLLVNDYDIDTLRAEELSVESFIVLARSMVK
ncbi:MAG: ribosomal RNA small subunit methyltransferase A [Spirochaetales bacterium]|nr:ribosomal RNA small subunit methyltransferase A [Spirochaetales bacterium]